jgi:hypothetical protein
MSASTVLNNGEPLRSSAENIGPDDPRYGDLVRRGFNKRFEGRPDYVRLVGSADDVVDAVQEAVRSGRRLAVRSGGHCLEGFVANPDVRALIDMSPMTGVSWDPEMGAFAVEAGTTLGEMHRRMFMGWGVVLPVGQSPDIGIGGHACGSAFGWLHRQHGLAGDHLYAVEVVVVDEAKTARRVVATREADDPNRELWWAHTGGGGGNFGVVTRYWFRSHGVDGREASRALPRAPGSVVTLRAEWKWADMSDRAFTTLLRNHGEWCERNSDASSAYATMFGVLTAGTRAFGKIELRGLSIDGDDAELQLDQFLSAVGAGVGVHSREMTRMSWLAFAVNPFPEFFAISPGGVSVSVARMKMKDALLKRRLSDRQAGVLYRALTAADAPGGFIGLATYGGRVNTVASDATAASQRESVIDSAYAVGWMDPADEARSLAWVRELYGEVFAELGGVPAPGAETEGALITHPDADLADPAWNTSRVPWHWMYYLGNYGRLQQVKARWDPRNVFQHVLSVRTADR